MSTDTLLVSEIFFSLAGEGADFGVPTIYVRLFGCNLNPPCPFCDSMYAVNKIDDSAKKMTFDEIVKTIKSYIYCKRVSFTGGEPLLYINKIKKIIKKLGLSYTYQFETNGSIPPINSRHEDILPQIPWKNMYYSVSPKFHAIEFDEDNKYCKSIEKWTRLPNTSLKFVYENEDTALKINRLKFILRNFNHTPVYVMPEGRNIDIKKYQECAKACMKYNWNFSIRLQCLLWNDERGT